MLDTLSEQKTHTEMITVWSTMGYRRTDPSGPTLHFFLWFPQCLVVLLLYSFHDPF